MFPGGEELGGHFMTFIVRILPAFLAKSDGNVYEKGEGTLCDAY